MSSQSRRNRIGYSQLLIFIAVLLIYPAVEQKIKLGLWHLWNGNTVRLHGYEIPVPTNWIADHTGAGDVILFAAGTILGQDQVSSMIFISQGPASEDMDMASSIYERSLESWGAQIFERRTVEFDGGKADCIVSNEFMSIASRHGPPISFNGVMSVRCVTTARISLDFNGDKENMDTFFSIVLQMRKANDEAQTSAVNNVK
jgi:hypothetical protein